jgi:hypothetical protein
LEKFPKFFPFCRLRWREGKFALTGLLQDGLFFAKKQSNAWKNPHVLPSVNLVGAVLRIVIIGKIVVTGRVEGAFAKNSLRCS